MRSQWLGLWENREGVYSGYPIKSEDLEDISSDYVRVVFVKNKYMKNGRNRPPYVFSFMDSDTQHEYCNLEYEEHDNTPASYAYSEIGRRTAEYNNLLEEIEEGQQENLRRIYSDLQELQNSISTTNFPDAYENSGLPYDYFESEIAHQVSLIKTQVQKIIDLKLFDYVRN